MADHSEPEPWPSGEDFQYTYTNLLLSNRSNRLFNNNFSIYLVKISNQNLYAIIAS